MYKVNQREIAREPVAKGAKGVTKQVLIGPEHGAPNFATRLFTVAPGGHTPLETHPWEHEVFVLRGEGVARSDSEQRPFGPGDAILVLPDEEHQFRNTGADELAFICVIPNSGGSVPKR